MPANIHSEKDAIRASSEYDIIDMNAYKRKAHFDYFKTLAYPYVGVTLEVDVSEFVNEIRRKEIPFFLSFLWCVSQAANEVPVLRQRIVGEGIIEYKRCCTSHTVAKEDGTYSYCTLSSDMTFDEFIKQSKPLHELAKQHGTIHEDENEIQSLFFISSLPWFSYTSLIQPVPIPADSNPRITWGRYKQVGTELLMPLTILCHHALVDGQHIADFYEKLKLKMKVCIDEISK